MQILRKFCFILTKLEIKQLIILSFGMIILSISEAFGVGIIIPILNFTVNAEKIASSRMWGLFVQYTGIVNPKAFLTILFLFAIAVFVFKAIFSVFLLYRQQFFAYSVLNRLTSTTLLLYLEKPYCFHLENNSASLFKNINSEVSNFSTGFLISIMTIGSETLIIMGIFLLLIWAYPLMTISLIFVFIFITLVMNFFFKIKITLYSDARKKYSDQMYKIALESLHAVKEIKIYNVSKFFINKFYIALKKYMDSLVKFNIISGVPRYIFETFLFIAALLILLVNINLNRSFDKFIPMMLVMGIASLKLLPSINKIYSNINQIHFSLNSLDIVYNILREASSTGATNNLIEGSEFLTEQSNCIRFQNLSFSYKTASESIFTNLNLSIPLNKTVAFVGKTGSGKSTLIDIITGLLVPSEGNLYFRDSLINLDNIQDYRNKIGYVPQNIYLTDDTIAENIAFGIPQPDIDYEGLEMVAKECQLGDFIGTLPNGFKTQVGERGVRISGGQKQRIGIARALYRKPEILILDEATSALDMYTESGLYNSLKKTGKTIIMVTHRLSTVQNADIIYVIDEGKIVDSGNYNELLEKSYFFRALTKEKSAID